MSCLMPGTPLLAIPEYYVEKSKFIIALTARKVHEPGTKHTYAGFSMHTEKRAMRWRRNHQSAYTLLHWHQFGFKTEMNREKKTVQQNNIPNKNTNKTVCWDAKSDGKHERAMHPVQKKKQTDI